MCKTRLSKRQGAHQAPLSRRFTPTLLAGVLSASLLLCPAAVYSANNDNQLKDVIADIAQQEKNVKEQQQRRNELQSQLKEQEKSVAQFSKELRKSQSQLNSLNSDIKKLSSSIATLKEKQEKHQKYLAEQLDAAFRIGRHTGLQAVLEQQQSERSERILAYYQYLNEARQRNIEELTEIQTALTAQRQEQEQKQEKQKTVLKQQKVEQTKLEQAKNERQKTLTKLESSLQKDQQKLAELKQNEAKLRAQILKAEREAKARAAREAKEAQALRRKQQQAAQSGSAYVPTQAEKDLMARTEGLGRPAGRYVWPVQGKILHAYGELLQGELRWKGMVISAREGSEVRAISDGRVLLADWLQGYGLVIVVEHGKTDLSLYGYNQSVLVNVGDHVKAGQPIGLVGISGGQKQPSLYFEIRRQGKVVNPQPWLKK